VGSLGIEERTPGDRGEKVDKNGIDRPANLEYEKVLFKVAE